MVYANVPEHEGFNKKGAKEAYEAELSDAPRSVEELLTSIDSNIQTLVDALNKAQAEEDDVDDGRPTEDWSKADIEEYAEKAGVDLTGHKGSRADMVEHINTTLDTPPADAGDNDPGKTEVTGD